MPVVILFILYSVLSIYENKKNKSIILNTLPILWILLILICTFRPENIRDYYVYKSSYYFPEYSRFEFLFLKIEELTRLITNNYLLFFSLCAAISTGLNLVAIKQLSHTISLSTVIYLSHFFILHDLIQIRCAIACGIILWSIKDLIKNNFTIFFVKILIATLFHYSAIIFAITALLEKNSIKNLYFWLIPLAIIASLININISNITLLIPYEPIQQMLRMYQNRVENGFETEINIFSILQLMRYAIYYYILFNIKKISKYNYTAIILTKIYGIGLFLFIILSDFPVLSFRISEIMICIETILIPMIVYSHFNQRKIYNTLVIGIGGIFLLLNLLYTKTLPL